MIMPNTETTAQKNIYISPETPTIYYVTGFCSRYRGELKDNLEKCIYSIQGETDNWAWALPSDACSKLSLNSCLIECPFSQEFQASLQTYMHTKILVICLMIAWDLIEFNAVMNTHTPYFSYKMHPYSKKLLKTWLNNNQPSTKWLVYQKGKRKQCQCILPHWVIKNMHSPSYLEERVTMNGEVILQPFLQVQEISSCSNSRQLNWERKRCCFQYCIHCLKSRSHSFLSILINQCFHTEEASSSRHKSQLIRWPPPGYQ